MPSKAASALRCRSPLPKGKEAVSPSAVAMIPGAKIPETQTISKDAACVDQLWNQQMPANRSIPKATNARGAGIVCFPQEILRPTWV